MKTIITFFLISLLTACGGTMIQKEVVQDNKTQLVVIPAPLLEPCDATEPPNKQLFVLAGRDIMAQNPSADTTYETIINRQNQRLQIMTDYVLDLTKDLAKCNNKITQIKILQDKQRNIYTSPLENR